MIMPSRPMRRRAHAPRPAEHSTQAGRARSVIAAQAIRSKSARRMGLCLRSSNHSRRRAWVKPVVQISALERHREPVCGYVAMIRNHLAGRLPEPGSYHYHGPEPRRTTITIPVWAFAALRRGDPGDGTPGPGSQTPDRGFRRGPDAQQRSPTSPRLPRRISPRSPRSGRAAGSPAASGCGVPADAASSFINSSRQESSAEISSSNSRRNAS